MTLAPDIATDLVTPLGAYLRLRRRGYLAEAEACGEPVVGYLAYDYAARLE